MTLNAFSAAKRLAIYEDLQNGREPREGAFDAASLKQARTKGHPQMGATSYRPDAIVFEFIYPDPGGAAVVLSVTVAAPERIVFMPVPEWVVDNIWQGDVSGTHQFASDAHRLLEAFGQELEVGPNQKWFGPQPAKRRE